MCLIEVKALPLCQIETRRGRVEKPERLEKDGKKSEREVERIFFTFLEAQNFLGISHQTLYKLMREGLASHKIGKKRVFLKEDLVRWIKEH
jgi:excisionase family DNA binding protein